jgi:hypothetical protein
MTARSSARPATPPRPGAALAAAVIGIVVGAQIIIGSFVQLGSAIDNSMAWLLAVIAPIGVVWLVGGIQMLGGSRTALLIGSVAWLVLMVAFVVWGWINSRSDSGQPLSLQSVLVPAVVFAAVPVIVLRLAYRPTVTRWIDER